MTDSLSIAAHAFACRLFTKMTHKDVDIPLKNKSNYGF